MNSPTNETGNKKFQFKDRLKSFRNAFTGLFFLFRSEHNARIHLAVLIVVILAGIFLRINTRDWISIAFAAGLVLSGKSGAVDRLMGNGMVFNIIAAVVLGGIGLTGGKGNLIGALGGVLFFSVMTSVLSWFEVNAFAIRTVTGFIILFVIILDALKTKIRYFRYEKY